MIYTKINNAYVIENEAAPKRWIDAIGDCIKWKSGPGAVPAYQMTVTAISDGAGTSTFVNSNTAGNYGLITTAAGDYDGISAQLLGEAFAFTSSNKIYAETSFTVSDEVNCDALFGFAETDTTLFAVDTAHALAVTGSGIFFYTLDASDNVYLGIYDGGTAISSTKVGDLTTSAMKMAMLWDGAKLTVMVDDAIVATITDGIPTEAMRLSFDFHTGENVANTCEIGRSIAIQV